MTGYLRAIAPTRAPNQEAAASLIDLFGPDEGGENFDSLLAEQQASSEQAELPHCPLQEAEAEPMSYYAGRASQHSHVRMEAMAV